MYTNAEILDIAMRQSALDAGCEPGDFARAENAVVISRPNERARRYLKLPFFCNLISYGGNVVASVDARIKDFASNYIDEQDAHSCFETPRINLLAAEFSKYGFMPRYMAEYWLPDMQALKELPCEFELRVLESGDFEKLYIPQWHNALCENRRHLDVLGVGAYDGGELIGLAGCSADCDEMWQIGIDVLPAYRRRGAASALTARLALEIISRGRVPFYCCAWSNIGSARNAIKSGFRPAWVELTSIDAEKASAEEGFWTALDKLIARSELKIDRPAGTKHPRHDFVYPFDYGYLAGTSSMDGGGIDVWRGSLGTNVCDAVICTIDLMKNDSEIKLLLGCTEEEKAEILRFHNESEYMKGALIRRALCSC